MATENKKYIPTLRFPEFQNDGEWKRCKLSDVAVRKGKKNTKGIELPIYTNSATSGVISQEDYFDREIVTKENLVNYGIIEPNDFVYNPRVSVTAPVGPISRNKLSRGIMSPLYLIFGFNGGDINFFEHYFKGNSWHNYLRAKANYGARFDRINIGTKEFMDMPIPYPSLAEQKKIADCLSSLDKYIDATKRKLELLKEYKKGLMQRLFPAKGKTTPEIRFPEFQNDGEWKIVLLKDFTERIKSKVGNAQLRPISISAGIGFVDQKNKFGRDISGNQYSNYIELKKGEFAYNKGNSIKYPQGCVYQLKEFEIVACPNVFVCFRIINNSVCPDFMSAYFASNYHGKQLQQYITSGVRSNGLLNISAETFLGIKTPLPSVSEQKKIAECLSSLDKYIDETSCKLEQLKGHKNGLMQQLFPKL